MYYKRPSPKDGGNDPGERDAGNNPAVESVRRTMIKLRPLQQLRAESAALTESWPALPTKWILDEDDEEEAQTHADTEWPLQPAPKHR
jgi:hypothetical protein